MGVNDRPHEASHQGNCPPAIWVAGTAETIIGSLANEPTSGRQWYQKGPSGKRIAPGNLDFADILPLAAFVHMMPPEQLDLILELTNERLATKAKKELTRQELLRWIGLCIMIGMWSCHPPEQPDGMLLERYRWMLINDFVANINKVLQRTFVPGGHLESNKTVIR